MQKKTLCLVLTLTIVYLAESLPLNFGHLELNNFDYEYPDLRYEVEQDDKKREDDLDAFSKLLGLVGEASKSTKKDTNEKSKDGVKTNVKTSGFKKINKETEGLQSKHNSGDLNTFFKIGDVHDHGDYDDADEYVVADRKAATAAVTKGKLTRTYKKGKKTTGFHRVHHKDEYKKDQDFYDEDETKGTITKGSAQTTGTKVGAGAGYKKTIFDHERQKGIYGKQGYLDNGFLDKENNVFSDSQGFDGSFSNENL